MIVPSSYLCVFCHHFTCLYSCTALYATITSDRKNTANHAKSIKELVYYDILAVDNSVNGGETLEKKDDDGKQTTMVYDCGEKAVLTVYTAFTFHPIKIQLKMVEKRPKIS